MNRIFEKIIIRLIYKSRLNVWLGKVFFYNSGGILSNLIGLYIKKRDRKEAKKFGFVLKKNEGSDLLTKNGFLIQKDLNNQNKINDLLKKWNSYAIKFNSPKNGRFELSSADRNEETKNFIPLLTPLINTELINVIENYLGCYMKIINFHIYRNTQPNNYDLNNSFGSTGNWHNDGSTSESLKLFFMLDHVNNDNGPMQILSIQDTKFVFKNKKFYFPDKKNKTKKFINKNCKPITLIGNKGTAFLALTNFALHRATIPNKNQHRDLAVFYITTSSKKISIKDQLENANYREIIGFKRLFMY
jgi:hypothetical protein